MCIATYAHVATYVINSSLSAGFQGNPHAYIRGRKRAAGGIEEVRGESVNMLYTSELVILVT